MHRHHQPPPSATMKNKEEYWVTSALTNDNIVADFLVRIKQSSQSSTSKTTTTWLSPIRWGHRKSRSKPPSIVTNNNTAATKQQQHQQSGSPTTPLCWSGGAGTSTDGYDESSRSGDRSNKGALGNEGATTSGYKKSRKRKSFAVLKEEEDFLLKERQQLNRELQSMRVTMSTQIATSQNLKKFKIDLHKKPEEEMNRTTNMVNHQAHTSSIVEAETKAHKTGFVLPDLNMAPDEEAL